MEIKLYLEINALENLFSQIMKPNRTFQTLSFINNIHSLIQIL